MICFKRCKSALQVIQSQMQTRNRSQTKLFVRHIKIVTQLSITSQVLIENIQSSVQTSRSMEANLWQWKPTSATKVANNRREGPVFREEWVHNSLIWVVQSDQCQTEANRRQGWLEQRKRSQFLIIYAISEPNREIQLWLENSIGTIIEIIVW